MCLVLAVVIVSKHYVLLSHSAEYPKQMSKYLSNLQTIHPSANFHLYHHLSLHLPFFFHLFGPSHCFWTYPFEQLIGWIQHLLSNHKIGTLSWLHYTMWLIVFARSNGVNSPDLMSEGIKIRQWLTNLQAPVIIQEIQSLYDCIYTPNSTDAADTVNDQDKLPTWGLARLAIPKGLQPILCPSDIEIHLQQARLKQDGVIYLTSKTHEGNSQIFFYPNGDRMPVLFVTNPQWYLFLMLKYTTSYLLTKGPHNFQCQDILIQSSRLLILTASLLLLYHRSFSILFTHFFTPENWEWFINKFPCLCQGHVPFSCTGDKKTVF